MERFNLRMECKTGGSNKFYEVHVEITTDANGARWWVMKKYSGPIGKTAVPQGEVRFPSAMDCVRAVDKLESEKTGKKNYVVTRRDGSIDESQAECDARLKAQQQAQAKTALDQSRHAVFARAQAAAAGKSLA